MGTVTGRGYTSKIRAEEKTPKLRRPSKYQVYLLNDDYTPMDFVVIVLQQFFRMSYTHAVKVMLDVHQNGKGVCGIYPRDIAETITSHVNEFAKLNDHPLLCKMEKI